MLPEIAVCRELATALRAGDDSAAAGLAARAGIPRWLLTHLEQVHGPTVLHYGTYCDRRIILGDIG